MGRWTRAGKLGLFVQLGAVDNLAQVKTGGPVRMRGRGPAARTPRNLDPRETGWGSGVMGTQLFEQAAAVFRSVLTRVSEDQLGDPTPCEPLTVAELISKAIGHQDWVRGALAGLRASPQYPEIDPARYLDAFDRSTAAMLAELRSDGAMGRTVVLAGSLSFPGSDVMVLAARNIFQFAWDLAKATGQSTDLAPEVAAELLDISRTRLIPPRGPGGFFGPEFVPPDGAPVADVLAGFLGRKF